MATGAAEMILQCVFDGCLAMQDMEVERRPYHRNCTCALHKLKGVCSNTCSQQSKISFPMKQSWTCYSFSSTPSKASYQSSLLDRVIQRLDTAKLE